MEPHILSLPQITSKFCRNTLIEAQPYAPLHPFRSNSWDKYNTQNQCNLLSLSLNTPSPPLHRWRSEFYASLPLSYKQTRDKLKQTFTHSLVHPGEEVSQSPLHQQLPVPPIRSFSSVRTQEQQHHLAVTSKSVRIDLIENPENQSHSSNNKLNNANLPFLLGESLQPVLTPVVLSHPPPKASRQLTKLRLFSMSIPDPHGLEPTHPSYLFPRFNRPSLHMHRSKAQEHTSCHVSNIELEMMDAPHPQTFPNLYVSCWNNRLVCLHGRRKPTDITKNELYLIGHSNFANHSLLSLSMPCLSPSKPVDPYSSFRTLAPSACSNLDQLYMRAPNNSEQENYSPPPHSSPGSDQFNFTRADSYKSTPSPVPPSPILGNSRTDYNIIQSPPSKSTYSIKKSHFNSSSHQIPRLPSNSSSHQIPRSPNSSSHQIPRLPSNSSSHQIPRSPNSSSHQIPRLPSNSSSHQIPRSPNSSSHQIPRSPNSSSHQIPRLPSNSSSHQIPRLPSNSSSYQIPRSPNSSSHQIPRLPSNSSSHQIPRLPSNSSSYQIPRSPSNTNPFPLQQSPNGRSHPIIKSSSATEFHYNNTPLKQSRQSNISPFSNDASYTENFPSSTDVINTPQILQSLSDVNQISIKNQPISLSQSQQLNLNPLVQVSDTPFSRDLRGEENGYLNGIMNYQERELDNLTDKQPLPPISHRKDKRNLVFKEVPVKWRVSANPHFENNDTSLLNNKEVIHSKVSQSLRGSPFAHSEDRNEGRVVGSSRCSSSSGDSDSGNPITPSFIDNFIDELVFGIDFYNKMVTRGESRECSVSRNSSKRRDHPSSRSRERERGSRHLHRHLASSYGMRMNRIREQRRTNLKIQLSMKQMEKLKQKRKKLSGDGSEILFNITRAYTYSYFRSGCTNGTVCSTQNSDVDDDSGSS